MPMPPDLRQLAQRLNNWGRWGDDDQRGTLNLITPEAIRRGAASVRRGAAIPLAIPFSADGPQTGAIPGRVNPELTMASLHASVTGHPDDVAFSDDVLTMGTQAATHWDSLAHAEYEGRLWNGHPPSSVDEHGAARCGMDAFGPVVSRGILLDVAAALGVDRLDPGHAITAEELDAAEARAGAAVTAGDIVLVRTGQMQLLHEGDRQGFAYPAPGLSTMTAPWLHERDVAAVATDTLSLEVLPSETDDFFLPVHALHLVEMGLVQGQLWDLEALSADCAGDGAYAFLLDASPLPLVRGLGAPVSPVAVK